jgi:AcrR family transcriptional regulator
VYVNANSDEYNALLEEESMSTSAKFKVRPSPLADVPTGAGAGRLRILEAAVRSFIRDGGAAFSARGVAKEAKMSLGAVQHFFPTKEQLLAAMLEHVVADFRRAFERLETELPYNGEARLLAVIDYLVADAWKPDSRKFFFNFYALSCHNAFAAELLNNTYAHHRHRLAAYIGAARPHLSEQECFDLALQLVALTEGLMVYTAPGARSVTPRQHLAETTRETVLRMLAK